MTPPHGGYVWWYVDALSDNGDNGITLIAFLGSVFSPTTRGRDGAAAVIRCGIAR